ncbi:MAG: Tm-1-like ATP-binding domain-containing protein, partial [Planctomycetes bacterium]|nr:Tm-1-like ATP-binding domain-containing protein [Planctomycetota bacterium]
MPVLLLATLDTKGHEAAFVRDHLRAAGVEVVLVDCGSLGEPQVRPDVTREELFRAAGTTLAAVRAQGERGPAVDTAARGAAALARRFQAEGKLSGVLGLGGSAGTTIGTAAMRALPLGVPKLMVSTLAAGAVGHYVGTADIAMLHSVVDLAGLNRISRVVLARAAQAMAGMAQGTLPAASADERPLVAATMFGVTTPCVEHARAVLETAGFEVLVFHATGSGGRTLEALIDSGLIAGVLDVTTTELADELVGGVLSAGPERLTAAARAGIPQVVSVGALDMVNFLAFDTVPAKFAGRRFHRHNANVTLMRTTAEENAQLGRELASKVARSRGPARIFLPLRGVSALDRAGQPFDHGEARAELYAAIRAHAGNVP